MPITYAGTTLPSGVYHGARPWVAMTTFLPPNEGRDIVGGLRARTLMVLVFSRKPRVLRKEITS